jgi:hypothetical protein
VKNRAKLKRHSKALVTDVVNAARIAAGVPYVSLRALVRGNAAGIHGGARERYSKRDRQQMRRDERSAVREMISA